MPRSMPEVFSQKWVDGLTPGREQLMPAKIRLYRQGERTYDPATNTYVYEIEELYSGKARVQPLRSAQARILPQDNTFVQPFLVSVPIDALKDVDVRLGDQIRVTEASLNPVLKHYQYAIQEFTDSANPIERTFLCSVDAEMEVV